MHRRDDRSAWARTVLNEDVPAADGVPDPLDPTILPAWRSLEGLAAETGRTAIRDLLATRGEQVHAAAGLTLDLSLQRIDDRVVAALLDLAAQTGVASLRDAMLAGRHINVTEDRAVLHTALRGRPDAELHVDGQDVTADVHAVLDHMADMASRVRDGRWRGATGERIRSVVNIGIGGSDLGPAMAVIALRPYSTPMIDVRFVSNVDPTDITAALDGLDPAATLIVVASKTFTTAETLANARVARAWITDALGEDAVRHHFVALSTNAEAVQAFGIDPSNMLGFWDWVGGRYSMDSAIGFTTMVAIGPEQFEDMLAGFRAMDEHFASAPAAENLPLLMGLIAVWNRTFLGIGTTAVLPYAQLLSRFPAYLQQLTMESNGKSVRRDGAPVVYETGAVFWGEPGTNGQHSFYQLLHQGTSVVACDVIVIADNPDDVDGQQQRLVANALAQASVLALGRTAAEVRADGTPEMLVPHKVMPGNRPTTVLMARRVDPFTLGALIALYEHSVFVQGAVWGIDSFDQWGVELGKRAALRIEEALASGDVAGLDPATAASVQRYRALRG